MKNKKTSTPIGKHSKSQTNQRATTTQKVSTNQNVKQKKYFPQMFINVSAVLITTLLAVYYVIIYNHDLLFKLQDNSIFLPTRYFFFSSMQTPGGFINWLGCFFTQFFYYPWLGGAIFILMAFLVQVVFNRMFRISSVMFPLSFIITLSIVLTVAELGYVIYGIKNTGYVFTTLFGVLISLLCLWGYKNLRSSVVRLIVSVLFVAALYPFMGFYSLFTALLLLVTDLREWMKCKERFSLVSAMVYFISVVLVPYVYFLLVYPQLSLANLYNAILPNVGFMWASILLFWLPYLVIGAFILLLTAFGNSSAKLQPTTFFQVGSLLGFILICIGFHNRTYRNENFKTELAMNLAIFDNRWEDVITLAKANKSVPTRIIVMDTRLALQKLNRAGDELFKFPQNSQRIISPIQIKSLNMLGKQMYFQYGQANYCYHWCVEDMVEMGMRVEYLKYMVKCSLMKAEFSLAQKYNDVLKQTLFYRAWADKYQKYIDNPRLMFEDKEFVLIRPLTGYDDKLSSNFKSLELDILNTLALPEIDLQLPLEYAIQSSLVAKDSKSFWPYYFMFLKHNQRVPRYYQEAALFFSYFEQKVDVKSLHFDKDILDRFQQLLKTCDMNVGNSKEVNMANFAPLFSDTFWYYYFFVTPALEEQ